MNKFSLKLTKAEKSLLTRLSEEQVGEIEETVLDQFIEAGIEDMTLIQHAIDKLVRNNS